MGLDFYSFVMITKAAATTDIILSLSLSFSCDCWLIYFPLFYTKTVNNLDIIFLFFPFLRNVRKRGKGIFSPTLSFFLSSHFAILDLESMVGQKKIDTKPAAAENVRGSLNGWKA